VIYFYGVSGVFQIEFGWLCACNTAEEFPRSPHAEILR
jgi:hypothetical protein